MLITFIITIKKIVMSLIKVDKTTDFPIECLSFIIQNNHENALICFVQSSGSLSPSYLSSSHLQFRTMVYK